MGRVPEPAPARTRNPSNRPFGNGAERELGPAERRRRTISGGPGRATATPIAAKGRVVQRKPTAHAQRAEAGQRSLGCVAWTPPGRTAGAAFARPAPIPSITACRAAPGEPGVSRSGAGLCRGVTPSSSRGDGWRWVLAAGGALVIAMVIIAVLAFRLGRGRSTRPRSPARHRRPPRRRRRRFRSPTCTNKSCRPW